MSGLPPATGIKACRNLYLHIPFCRHKCGYCDFNAYAGMDGLMPAYVDALLAELEAASVRLPFEPLDSVYLGGGTPSLLPAEQAARLLAGVRRLFALAPEAEVTLEANPASTDPERLETWRSGGVNRLSLGVQGFERAALAVLERRTDGAQAERAYLEARRAGFGNISLDLIYGVPGLDLEGWRRALRRALAWAPDHLSCYCLSFEEGTLLHRRLERGELQAPDSDRQWEHLDVACEELETAGYRRYEVSSWARPGAEARHNQAYWTCRPVYGAGAGAHSYATDGERAWRWWNLARPRAYMSACPWPQEEGEELSPRQARAEALMLGLRSTAGADGRGPEFSAALEELEIQGLLERSGDHVRPTRRGLDLNNRIALAVL